jgi:hypothetical protein
MSPAADARTPEQRLRDQLASEAYAQFTRADIAAVLAELDAARADSSRLDEIEWFGCNTGDCPHSQQAECDIALLGVVRSVLAERESARFLAATKELREEIGGGPLPGAC